ncbi:MAG: methyltransferase domain-containing protein [Myxococcota bacterium]|nr:methyltransferase domain-containing protein [Myxococcota bacterium]
MDPQADAFLQWAAPRRGLRWFGFRRNRRQVYRRLRRRIAALGLPDVAAYRRFLDEHPDEWTELERLCRVTISRFRRDGEIWTVLVDDVLPRLARDAAGSAVRAWSAGCGAGEEAYTLTIAWALAVAPRVPAVALDVLATDIDAAQLARAATAGFPTGSLRELPAPWRHAAFDEHAAHARLREPFRTVRFASHDLRTPPPPGPFDLVLCRNLAFSYFDEPTQRSVAASLRSVLRPNGVLVVGHDETLPPHTPGFTPLSPGLHLAAP